MEKLRYNRVFKQGLAAVLFGCILFISIVVFFIISKIQYDRLVSNMNSIEATIVDIDIDVHLKGPDEQEIYIEYVVDGVVYSRELETDTEISFAAGTGAHYLVGDKIQIYYDPQNPGIVAAPRSVAVGYFWLVFALLSLALGLFALWWMIKMRHKFLITQEEYRKEGEEIKRRKSEEKQQKKKEKLARKKEHRKARKIVGIVLIVLGCLVGGFIIWLLFGLLLISLGY